MSQGQQHAIEDDQRWGEVVLSPFPMLGVETYALLSYYAASSGNLLPAFRDSPSFPSSLLKVLIE